MFRYLLFIFHSSYFHHISYHVMHLSALPMIFRTLRYRRGVLCHLKWQRARRRHDPLPITMDDTEVLSRRTSPGRGGVGEAVEKAPEVNTSVTEDIGEATPMTTNGGDPNNPGPSRTPLQRPIRLRDQVSNPLQKRGEEHLLRRRTPLIRRCRTL